MSGLREELKQELLATDKEYRHGYADESLNANIATQIKVLREQRGWRQEDLAREADMTQPMISRYENVNYSSWSISTLKRFAWAYDVWLDLRFRSFGDLVRTTDEFGRESLQVPTFADDPFFREIPPIAAHTAGTFGVGSLSQDIFSAASRNSSVGFELTESANDSINATVANLIGKLDEETVPIEAVLNGLRPEENGDPWSAANFLQERAV